MKMELELGLAGVKGKETGGEHTEIFPRREKQCACGVRNGFTVLTN